MRETIFMTSRNVRQLEKKLNTFSVKFKNPPQFHSIIYPLERKELNKWRFNMR